MFVCFVVLCDAGNGWKESWGQAHAAYGEGGADGVSYERRTHDCHCTHGQKTAEDRPTKQTMMLMMMMMKLIGVMKQTMKSIMTTLMT